MLQQVLHFVEIPAHDDAFEQLRDAARNRVRVGDDVQRPARSRRKGATWLLFHLVIAVAVTGAHHAHLSLLVFAGVTQAIYSVRRSVDDRGISQREQCCGNGIFPARLNGQGFRDRSEDTGAAGQCRSCVVGCELLSQRVTARLPPGSLGACFPLTRHQSVNLTSGFIAFDGSLRVVARSSVFATLAIGSRRLLEGFLGFLLTFARGAHQFFCSIFLSFGSYEA